MDDMLTLQESEWMKGNGNPPGDCALTTAQISFGIMAAVMGPNNFDPVLDSYTHLKESASFKFGDAFRYGYPNEQYGGHYTSLIFRNMDGTPVVFSKNGDSGAYTCGPAANYENLAYGKITGRFRK
jgi:hypothetical protein